MRGPAEGERTFRAGGEPWRAAVAWRAADGSGLCYFRPGEGASPGLEDRRARLSADRSLGSLDAGALEEILQEASPLTDTERRFRAPDGRPWLAQNVGPVWAEEEAAEGATGVLFTALDGSAERLRAGGGHVARMSDAELEEAWRRAAGESSAGGGEEDSDGGG